MQENQGKDFVNRETHLGADEPFFRKQKSSTAPSHRLWHRSPSLRQLQLPYADTFQCTAPSVIKEFIVKKGKFLNADALHKSSSAPGSLLSCSRWQRKDTVCVSPCIPKSTQCICLVPLSTLPQNLCTRQTHLSFGKFFPLWEKITQCSHKSNLIL